MDHSQTLSKNVEHLAFARLAGDSAFELMLTFVLLFGTSTGGGLNPARQFGPTVVSGHTDELWVFLVAPMVAAGIAARLLQAFQRQRQLLAHRLCGTHTDGRRLDERRGTAGCTLSSGSGMNRVQDVCRRFTYKSTTQCRARIGGGRKAALAKV